MKKISIIILSSIIGISLICLLFMQFTYVEEILYTRKRHFEETVNRCLYRTAYQLEVAEAMLYLSEDDNTDLPANIKNKGNDRTQMNHSLPDSVDLKSFNDMSPVMRNMFAKNFLDEKNANSILPGAEASLQDVLNEKYLYKKALVDEVVYSILYTASNRPLRQRIDFNLLDQTLRMELHNQGLDFPYHFVVTTNSGREIFRCSDYESSGEDECFSVVLFKNDPVSNRGVLKVHFTDIKELEINMVWYVLPSILFTVVLLVTVVVTFTLLFRQKKLSELKNDFINNMTHEFKTPISTISLAAQMLGDEAICKTPQMFKRLSTTINDEAKRLRFQVEKVLQLSMYDNQKANLKFKEVNVNELIAGVVQTFAIKVEKDGGKIITELGASETMVLADDMHLTNVIFNLLDNAVKYKRGDVKPELKVTTWNEAKKVCISIQDNGIGIRKADLKRIFERFFRVHTGNRHDVKGFGLGLAYVKKIISDHKGVICAESEIGVGTKFIIKMPFWKET